MTRGGGTHEVAWGVDIPGEVSSFHGKMALLLPLDPVVSGDDA